MAVQTVCSDVEWLYKQIALMWNGCKQIALMWNVILTIGCLCPSIIHCIVTIVIPLLLPLLHALLNPEGSSSSD